VAGPKPAVGARLAFKTVSDTAQFVRAGEVEGYPFEGKECLSARLRFACVRNLRKTDRIQPTFLGFGVDVQNDSADIRH